MQEPSDVLIGCERPEEVLPSRKLSFTTGVHSLACSPENICDFFLPICLGKIGIDKKGGGFDEFQWSPFP